jgi:type IV secretory pathway protease TraF
MAHPRKASTSIPIGLENVRKRRFCLSAPIASDILLSLWPPRKCLKHGVPNAKQREQLRADTQ